MALAW